MIESLKEKFAEAFSSEEMQNKIINNTTDVIYKDLSDLLERSLELEVAERVVTKLLGHVQDESQVLNGFDEAAISGSGDLQNLIAGYTSTAS